MEGLKVLITTSGLGSRLGNLTDYTNKSLVRVGDKPAISHIVESYPSNTRFVVTLGHYGSHVREFLQLSYPDIYFYFIEVKNYKGPKSSLLHSMRSARGQLQCPFIFHVCDSIIFDNAPPLEENWISGAKSQSSDQYRTINMSARSTLLKINDKGEIKYDLAYPGRAGIKDYDVFWDRLDDIIDNVEEDKVKNLSDCHVIQTMLDIDGIEFKIDRVSDWYDIGEPYSLAQARNEIKSSIQVLDKVQENIYIIDKSVIKFFHNSNHASKRVKRAEFLKGLVPEIESFSRNFFKYRYVDGNLFADSVTPAKMKLFLNWALKNMWNKKSSEDISSHCFDFYFEKTKNRVSQFLNGSSDCVSIINGEEIPPVSKMLSKIDDRWLCDGVASIFHGDLILDNIIEVENGFSLIDWRQDFAGRLDLGDTYYDLAKLNHNLIFNHELVNQNHYMLRQEKEGVYCDILCRKNLIDCREVLHCFIDENGYDIRKVNMLTALIWINMSPLHDYPLDRFLFNFGKYNLFLSIKDRLEGSS